MANEGIVLPMEKTKGTRQDPKVLVLYGPPKVGKTTLLSLLPGNLIADLEEGTEYVDSISMRIIGWNAPANETKASIADRLSDKDKNGKKKIPTYYFTEVGKSIMLAGRPYKFLTVDTVTELEDMVMQLAVEMYKNSPMGGNYDGNNVKELARGAGYFWLRQAFNTAIDKIKKLADTIILVGHVKDTFIDKKGKEVAAKELDLTGKIKFTVSAGADAIGYLHRGPDSEILINFKASDEIVCGSRCPHLKGQEIKVADYDEETNELINVNWDLIFPSLKNKI
mgnify:FL=1|tara:strand:- start:13032 stop:13874 length:843 start_codon:yes stop_codon:yes gene_type:complete